MTTVFFYLNQTSGAICCNSKLQSTVADSTAEAAAAALFAATQVVIFLRVRRGAGYEQRIAEFCLR